MWGKNPVRGAAKLVAAALVAGLALSGCTISLPAPEPTATGPSVPPPSFVPPTVVAGHDAKAVASKPMSFEAGKTLAAGVPVGYSSILDQPPQDYSETPGPPDWKVVAVNKAGETQYGNAAGCRLSTWTTTNQGPLIVQNDDKGSTLALMRYLIPSVVESALKADEWPWVAEAGKKGPTISFLSFSTKAGKGVMASTVWARMLGTADTGLLITLACPSDALLAQTTPKVKVKLSVAPPSN